ncbi:MAG TPA: hypothetical protein VFE17_03310 [Candidatus Baltobacteraceae bacterium]|nr:hypothetical protein [Candidatus Baltobacteraceae bacterium]
MMLPLALAVLLVVCVAITGYGKLTLLHQYRVEEYLATVRARRLYWGVRIAAAGLAASIAGLGLCTRIWWVELPAILFAAFTLYINARAVFFRLSGKYIEYYRQRGWR